MTVLGQAIEYLWAAFGNWWFAIVAGILTLLEVSERVFARKIPFPQKARVGVAILALVVAPFLAYRDLGLSKDAEIRKLREALPRVFEPEVVKALIQFQLEGESILQAGVQACGTKSNLTSWNWVEASMRDWENKVRSYLAENSGPTLAAIFASNSGWTISGRMFTACGDDRKALALSRFQHKIEVIKGLYFK